MNYRGREVMMLGCDLGDRDAPQYVHEAADQLGRFDILVNNAAARGPIGDAADAAASMSVIERVYQGVSR